MAPRGGLFGARHNYIVQAQPQSHSWESSPPPPRPRSVSPTCLCKPSTLHDDVILIYTLQGGEGIEDTCENNSAVASSPHSARRNPKCSPRMQLCARLEVCSRSPFVLLPGPPSSMYVECTCTTHMGMPRSPSGAPPGDGEAGGGRCHLPGACVPFRSWGGRRRPKRRLVTRSMSRYLTSSCQQRRQGKATCF